MVGQVPYQNDLEHMCHACEKVCVPLTYWLENICRHAVFKRRHVPLRSIGEDPVVPVKKKLARSRHLLQTATLLSFRILGLYLRAHSDLQRMSIVNMKVQ